MEQTSTQIPQQSYLQIFWRFLKFGLLAWGGPVAQIAMIRQELVDDEKWISKERFNRVLAVYQVLPGPEAHEMCVYFGMLAGGRIGAVLAGLGFMLPGFILMYLLSWLYVSYGVTSSYFQAVFSGMQPAVAALIVRAVHRIGSHALHDNRWLWGLAIISGLAQLLGVHFAITLLVAGAAYALVQRQQQKLALGLLTIFTLYLGLTIWGGLGASLPATTPAQNAAAGNTATVWEMLFSGLRSGLLTFGGAYTAIPFLQHDAVEVGQWLTHAQFLDGLALSGLLPAPLIIFSTFVGYLGGGPAGAVAITLGIFAPSFAFTLIGHELVEKLIENTAIHAFLDGITAGVVGLIAATALHVMNDTVLGIHAWGIFAISLLILFRSKAKWATAAIILGAGVYGLIFMAR